MRSEFSANKALFETSLSLKTFQVAKKVAQAFNNTVPSGRPEAKLSDMESMKEWQAKNNVFGKAMFIVD